MRHELWSQQECVGTDTERKTVFCFSVKGTNRVSFFFPFSQEQCSGRTCLHLAVDLQNLALVQQLIALGADVNSMTYGGHVPYHLTFGRQNGEIQKQLFVRTASPLRHFPDSESESEEELMSDDECVSSTFLHFSLRFLSFPPKVVWNWAWSVINKFLVFSSQGYDDIQFVGKWSELEIKTKKNH